MADQFERGIRVLEERAHRSLVEGAERAIESARTALRSLDGARRLPRMEPEDLAGYAARREAERLEKVQNSHQRYRLARALVGAMDLIARVKNLMADPDEAGMPSPKMLRWMDSSVAWATDHKQAIGEVEAQDEKQQAFDRAAYLAAHPEEEEIQVLDCEMTPLGRSMIETFRAREQDIIVAFGLDTRHLGRPEHVTDGPEAVTSEGPRAGRGLDRVPGGDKFVPVPDDPEPRRTPSPATAMVHNRIARMCRVALLAREASLEALGDDIFNYAEAWATGELGHVAPDTLEELVATWACDKAGPQAVGPAHARAHEPVLGRVFGLMGRVLDAVTRHKRGPIPTRANLLADVRAAEKGVERARAVMLRAMNQDEYEGVVSQEDEPLDEELREKLLVVEHRIWQATHQARRHRRACDDKENLLVDLEIIERDLELTRTLLKRAAGLD